MKLASIVKVTLVVMLSALFAGQSFAVSDEEKQAIAERIKPVGEVCVEGDESCANAVAAPASSGPRSGEEIYTSTCSGCHAAGVAGAPKFGDKAAWGPRIAQGKATLYKHALGGFNMMPPKGGCASCSDEEIKATVDYMASKGK